MENEGQRDFFRLIAGFLVPPVGVGMQEGINGNFWLNLVLTLLCFWVPGQIHAAWVIMRRDSDGARVEGGVLRFVALLCSYYLPPVGVALTSGVGLPLVVSLLLSLSWIVFPPLAVLYVPAIVHAVWIIATDRDED